MVLCNCNALSVPHVHDTGIRPATEAEKKSHARKTSTVHAPLDAPPIRTNAAPGSRFTTRVS
jgi:hypothetical protein